MSASKHQSMFGHLAEKFSAHPENLATESLNYILNRSATARRAFIRYLGQSGASLPDDLTFRTQQSGDDEAIPDLVGFDAANKQKAIAEAKFWAGLTDAQPVGYLKRLREQGGSLLVFLAPSMRFPTLWPELLRLCAASGITLKPNAPVTSEFLSATNDDRRVLALASWRSVLQYLRSAVETDRELETASDIGQLAGLCERMDDDAFWPLRSEELASVVGRRIVQLCGVVDEVTSRAAGEKLASLKGFKASAASGWYGRYMAIHGFEVLLALDANRWSDLRETPIWFYITGRRKTGDDVEYVYQPNVKEKLSKLELEQPSRLFVDGRNLLVPIYLPTGVERSEVVQAVFDQLEEIAALLRA